jgi:hypothetical protein
MDLGLMVEGFVELDAVSGRMVLRIPQADGRSEYLDIQEQLALHKGKEVRLICTPLESIATLAQMIESGEVPL